MVVLAAEVYNALCTFIRNFDGPAIDCEVALKAAFPDINTDTVESILAKEWQQQIKLGYPRISGNAKRFLQEYAKNSKFGLFLTYILFLTGFLFRYEAKYAKTGANDILLQIAVRERYSPIGLCRILLNERHRDRSKSEIAEMLRNPYSIPETGLAGNVLTCLFTDNRDGPISDIIRQCVGEEYEVRMKHMATAAGMHFHDEGDLRRGGYDKTPDLKLAVPCMFRGGVVNWIESKASFGDADSHAKYLKEQLCSYANRFGPGIVVYWFGYLESIQHLKENVNVVTVTDGFPAADELELLTFDN